MKCTCAQTRPRFILSSEGVFGGMEFEPMLTPREKSPLPENVPRRAIPAPEFLFESGYNFSVPLDANVSVEVVVVLFVGCLTSQQASVSQGRICTDNFRCCHTETEVADQTFYLTQSQYTDTGPTSPSADPITPGAWQGSQWSANF